MNLNDLTSFINPYIKRFRSFLRRDHRLLVYIIFFLLGVFGLLTLIVYSKPILGVDLDFTRDLQEERTPLIDLVMHGISWFGVEWVAGMLVGITVLLFLVKAYRWEALFSLTTLLSPGLVYIIKILVNRPRPTQDLVQIIENAQHQSFPSGHTAFYITFFGWLVYLMYRLHELPNALRWGIALPSLVLIFSVPYSRVYLGAHWLSDVVAGFIVGLLCLIAIVEAYLWSERKWGDRSQRCPEDSME